MHIMIRQETQNDYNLSESVMEKAFQQEEHCDHKSSFWSAGCVKETRLSQCLPSSRKGKGLGSGDLYFFNFSTVNSYRILHIRLNTSSNDPLASAFLKAKIILTIESLTNTSTGMATLSAARSPAKRSCATRFVCRPW